MAEYVVLRSQVLFGIGPYSAGQILTDVGPPTISTLIGAGLSVAPIIPPPGSTSNFLRQDGQWVPAAGGAEVLEHAPDLISVVSGAAINYTNGRGIGSPSGATSFYCTLPTFRRGDVIAALEIDGNFGASPSAYAFSLIQRDGNAFPATSTVQAFTPTLGGATQRVTLTLSTPKVVLANHALILLATLQQSQDSLQTISVQLQ